MHPPLPFRHLALLVGVAVALLEASGRVPVAAGAAGRQEQEPVRREITVVARKYAFLPARIEVQQNDLVKITFTTEDIPHSFTIDQYRIAKRAGPGQTVVFEFRADQVGTFPFYCNLTIDEHCREMRGELIVRAR